MKPHGKEEHPFEVILDRVKEEHHYQLDTELTVDNLKQIVSEFKLAVLEHTKKEFP